MVDGGETEEAPYNKKIVRVNFTKLMNLKIEVLYFVVCKNEWRIHIPEEQTDELAGILQS